MKNRVLKNKFIHTVIFTLIILVQTIIIGNLARIRAALEYFIPNGDEDILLELTTDIRISQILVYILTFLSLGWYFNFVRNNKEEVKEN